MLTDIFMVVAIIVLIPMAFSIGLTVFMMIAAMFQDFISKKD